MCLPATYIGDDNQGTTWVATNGREHRLDYVAQAWLPYVSQARVDRTVVLGHDDKKGSPFTGG